MEIPRTQHLILLVGSNPLPNAVAGKLLVEPGGAITLVHSRVSFAVAERLKAWLEKEHEKKVMVEMKEVSESEASSIYFGIWKCLGKIKVPSVGLNYTGGTKMMSVHAYRAVEQWAKDKGIIPIFSYLDARTLKMVFDLPDDSSDGRSKYVGLALNLRLKEDLLPLHGWTVENEPACEPLLPATAQALARACTSDTSFQEWKKWIRDELKVKCANGNGRGWRINSELRSVSLSLPRGEMLDEVARCLCNELNQQESSFALANLTGTFFRDNAGNFCDYLDGKWLEDYVLSVLSKLKDIVNLHQIAKNVKVAEVVFEVDVVAIRGYQLFVFSCATTNNRRELKKKLFEVYVRAQQLGGDEARIALVCYFEDPAGLQEEIRRDFDRGGRIRVFGRRHLVDLAAFLEDWIREQSGGER